MTKNKILSKLFSGFNSCKLRNIVCIIKINVTIPSYISFMIVSFYQTCSIVSFYQTCSSYKDLEMYDSHRRSVSQTRNNNWQICYFRYIWSTLLNIHRYYKSWCNGSDTWVFLHGLIAQSCECSGHRRNIYTGLWLCQPISGELRSEMKQISGNIYHNIHNAIH